MNNRLVRCLSGAVAGFAATFPMSLVMMVGRRKSLSKYFDPLPPRQITTRALKAVGINEQLSNESHNALTVVNHFAYGASMGGAYGAMSAARPALPAAITGICFGLGVWGVSYLGWLPSTGLYRSAADDSTKRNLRMLAAHVVWGGTLGCLTELVNRQIAQQQRPQPAKPNGSGANGRRQARISKPR